MEHGWLIPAKIEPVMIKNIIFVGLGGMIGSVLRYLISQFIRHDQFPYATLTVNMLGSLLIGMIMGMAGRNEDFSQWRLFLATGIMGGFTTFSAFAWENLQLLQQERYASFAAYTGGTMVLGLSAVALGYWISR